MRIFDEKGRLFGKINVIDFLVILFLLCLAPAFYFGYKILTKKPVGEVLIREFVEIETDCRLVKLKPELLKLISVSDKELNEDGQVIGEIISLGQTEPYKYEFDIGEKQKIIKEDPILKQIEARLKLIAEVKQGKPYYKDREIRIDSPIEFKTNDIILTAIPFEKEEEGEGEERIIDMNVTLKDLDEDTLKNISVGDKELDENGKTIAEILSLGKVESSSIKFDLGGGSSLIGEDKNKKQISAKMRLKCQVKDGNQLYFKGKKVAHSTLLEFKTDKYEIIGLGSADYKEYYKEKWISLQVKFSRVVPEIAEVIKKGDIEKDAVGKTIARIGSIISNEPALVVTITDEGEFVTLRHPFDKDIVASLDVVCMEKEGAYYFKNEMVKMGKNITFNTDLYSISGLIVGIEVK